MIMMQNRIRGIVERKPKKSMNKDKKKQTVMLKMYQQLFIGILFAISIDKPFGVPTLIDNIIWVSPYYYIEWEELDKAIEKIEEKKRKKKKSHKKRKKKHEQKNENKEKEMRTVHK